MAKSIITLGIGATDNLVPFMTTGLAIGAVVAVQTADNAHFVPLRNKRAFATFRDKRAFVPLRNKGGTGNNG